MKLSVFLDYYKPIDCKEKINKLFELCYSIYRVQMTKEEYQLVYDHTQEELKPLLKIKFQEHETNMNNLKLGRRLRLKKIRNKKKKSKSRKGSSVYNKNEYIYNWVHIISTPMK